MAVIPAGYKQTEVGVIPEDWDVRSIGSEIDRLEAGVSVNSVDEARQVYPHEQSILKTSAVTNGRFLAYEAKKIAPRDVSRAQLNPRADRIIVSRMNTPDLVGECGYVDKDYPDLFLPDRLWMTRVRQGSDISVKWLAYLLASEAYKRRLKGAATGTSGSMKNLSEDAFLSLPIPFPTGGEQCAIAAALSDVDALLAKLDQLIAKKRDLKQAAMQQLLTGQTRLPEFSGAWEVKRLGDVGTCLRGVSYRGDSDLSAYDTNSTKRLLRSNNVQDATVVTTDIQFVNAERVSARQLLQESDILICMANGSKALVGKAGLFQVRDGYDYTFGAFMGCFRSNSAGANAEFVFYLFQTGRYRNYINNLLAGSSINNLTPTSIESLEFSIPPLSEQTAIATVLADMDAELTALEARRDKTRALKQGMMQELLTGRIRLL